MTIAPVSQHFSGSRCKFGYMETPNVPKALAIARKQGWQFDIMSTSFFLSRRALKPAAHSGMPRWQDRLFIGLAKAPPMPPTSSRSRPGGWWKSGPRLPSDRFETADILPSAIGGSVARGNFFPAWLGCTRSPSQWPAQGHISAA